MSCYIVYIKLDTLVTGTAHCTRLGYSVAVSRPRGTKQRLNGIVTIEEYQVCLGILKHRHLGRIHA